MEHGEFLSSFTKSSHSSRRLTTDSSDSKSDYLQLRRVHVGLLSLQNMQFQTCILAIAIFISNNCKGFGNRGKRGCTPVTQHGCTDWCICVCRCCTDDLFVAQVFPRHIYLLPPFVLHYSHANVCVTLGPKSHCHFLVMLCTYTFLLSTSPSSDCFLFVLRAKLRLVSWTATKSHVSTIIKHAY